MISKYLWICFLLLILFQKSVHMLCVTDNREKETVTSMVHFLSANKLPCVSGDAVLRKYRSDSTTSTDEANLPENICISRDQDTCVKIDQDFKYLTIGTSGQKPKLIISAAEATRLTTLMESNEYNANYFGDDLVCFTARNVLNKEEYKISSSDSLEELDFGYYDSAEDIFCVVPSETPEDKIVNTENEMNVKTISITRDECSITNAEDIAAGATIFAFSSASNNAVCFNNEYKSVDRYTSHDYDSENNVIQSGKYCLKKRDAKTNCIHVDSRFEYAFLSHSLKPNKNILIMSFNVGMISKYVNQSPTVYDAHYSSITPICFDTRLVKNFDSIDYFVNNEYFGVSDISANKICIIPDLNNHYVSIHLGDGQSVKTITIYKTDCEIRAGNFYNTEIIEIRDGQESSACFPDEYVEIVRFVNKFENYDQINDKNFYYCLKVLEGRMCLKTGNDFKFAVMRKANRQDKIIIMSEVIYQDSLYWTIEIAQYNLHYYGDHLICFKSTMIPSVSNNYISSKNIEVYKLPSGDTCLLPSLFVNAVAINIEQVVGTSTVTKAITISISDCDIGITIATSEVDSDGVITIADSQRLVCVDQKYVHVDRYEISPKSSDKSYCFKQKGTIAVCISIETGFSFAMLSDISGNDHVIIHSANYKDRITVGKQDILTYKDMYYIGDIVCINADVWTTKVSVPNDLQSVRMSSGQQCILVDELHSDSRVTLKSGSKTKEISFKKRIETEAEKAGGTEDDNCDVDQRTQQLESKINVLLPGNLICCFDPKYAIVQQYVSMNYEKSSSSVITPPYCRKTKDEKYCLMNPADFKYAVLSSKTEKIILLSQAVADKANFELSDEFTYDLFYSAGSVVCFHTNKTTVKKSSEEEINIDIATLGYFEGSMKKICIITKDLRKTVVVTYTSSSYTTIDITLSNQIVLPEESSNGYVPLIVSVCVIATLIAIAAGVIYFKHRRSASGISTTW